MNSRDTQQQPQIKQRTTSSSTPRSSAKSTQVAASKLTNMSSELLNKLHRFSENHSPYKQPADLYTNRPNKRVNYLDGRSLSRSISIPRPVIQGSLVFVVIAAILGSAFAFQAGDTIVNAPAREAAAIKENLERDVARNLSPFAEIIKLDVAGILAYLKEKNSEVIELPSSNVAGGTLEAIVLPEGVTEADAALALAAWMGSDHAVGSSMIRMLNGGWQLSASSNEGINLNVHYADFKNGTEVDALNAAVIEQGLDGTTNSDITLDASGNTIQTGAITFGDTSYQWQVSVCPLRAIYNDESIPSTAMYVGIRLFQ